MSNFLEYLQSLRSSVGKLVRFDYLYAFVFRESQRENRQV